MAPRPRRRAAAEHATRTAPLLALPSPSLPSPFPLSSPSSSPIWPQLATSAKTAPPGKEWLHEIKIDGYRIGCRVDRGAATLWSRQGNDWTSSFPEIGAAAVRLPVTTAVLDGEVAVVRPDGRTSFDALQDALAGGPRAGLTYFVFDLLHLDGDDVAARPLGERKQTFGPAIGASTIRFALALYRPRRGRWAQGIRRSLQVGPGGNCVEARRPSLPTWPVAWDG